MMRIYYRATERKPLVQAISEFTGEKAKYLFMPTCAYEIGAYKVDKEGNVECSDEMDEISVNELKDFLAKKGFTAEEETPAAEPPEEETAMEETTDADMELTLVTVPLEKVNAENLSKLIEAKEDLICKALNLRRANVTVTGEKVFFPWLKGNAGQEEREACFHFIEALCKMSKAQKRITAKAKKVENEKYAFRCFLLRLGFIGNEYKAARKTLLKNFTGSSAFKAGKKKGEDDHAVSE